MTIPPATQCETAHVDVLVVGAGLSGIGAACHLQTDAPGATWAVVEAREASGGTWDLFRYPGVRSDSDMYTLGYVFQPWTRKESIASGDSILAYVRETAKAHGVADRIEYHRKVIGADWSSEKACWTVHVVDTQTGGRSTRTCGVLYLCSGYYRYDEGYTPDWPGRDGYHGQLIHPQHWPDDLDLTDKHVVVVGSGATAVTLVPALAKTAHRVTMLQRSPSYVMPFPADDPVAGLLRRLLPEDRAYRAIRWKNVKTSTAIYGLSRKYPARVKALLRSLAVKRLPEGFDVDRHFTPAYQPWDQRMCLVPDGDFFHALMDGKADVVTDHVEGWTEKGLLLRSGTELEADVVVTATGLNLLPLSGIALTVDGEQVRLPERIAYKGMMLDGVPNLFFALGYTNASWTLKVDLVSAFLARLVRHLREQGLAVATPRRPVDMGTTTPFIEMSSGYFERSRAELMRQGDRAPWRLEQHYKRDSVLFQDVLADPALELRPATARVLA